MVNTLCQQHKRSLYTWTSPDGQYQNQTDFFLCSWRWRGSIHSVKTRLGADWGSGHELLIAKFRLKLKKVGETTRPFKYDLNKIPYNYTVEVMNIQGIRSDRQRAWRTMDGGLWHWIGDSDQEKEIQKDKMIVWGGLTNSWEKKRSERQKRRGKIHPSECQSSKE